MVCFVVASGGGTDNGSSALLQARLRSDRMLRLQLAVEAMEDRVNRAEAERDALGNALSAPLEHWWDNIA